jgi:hypothetical protein
MNQGLWQPLLSFRGLLLKNIRKAKLNRVTESQAIHFLVTKGNGMKLRKLLLIAIFLV